MEYVRLEFRDWPGLEVYMLELLTHILFKLQENGGGYIMRDRDRARQRQTESMYVADEKEAYPILSVAIKNIHVYGLS